jgi:uncharacterized membrane protein YgdD (TMEM256/DUF423 family)
MTSKFFRVLMALSALFLASATGLGAWASHGLASSLDPASLKAFETGVSYQFIHSLGLLAVAIYAEKLRATKALGLAALVLLCGIVLFCGGVYASSLDGPGWIAMFAPAGGIGLILGWLGVGLAVLLLRNAPSV